MPYHPGAIRYFKEIGVWTGDHQAHTDRLLERQKLLQATWVKVQGAKSDPEEQYKHCVGALLIIPIVLVGKVAQRGDQPEMVSSDA